MWTPRIAKSGWPSEGREKAKRASGPATLRKATSGSTPATAPDLTRRGARLLPCAGCGRAAAPGREVLDLIADAAGSLSAGDAAGFLKAFGPAMAGYMKLRENVTGLIAQGDVQSLIDPLEDEGDGRRRVEQFQWTLRIHRGQESANFVRREQVVKCTVEKQGGKWRIVELEPIGFFAPES